MDEENENLHNTHIITKSTISNHSFQLNNSYFIQKNLNGNETLNKNNIYGSKIISDYKNNNNNNNDDNNNNLNLLFNQIYKKNTNNNKYSIYFKNLKNELDKNTDNENFINNKNNNKININKNKKLINRQFHIIENEKCNSKFQVVQTTLSLMKSPPNKINITNKFDEDSLEISKNNNVNSIIYKNLVKRKKSLNSIDSSKQLNNSENSESFIKFKKNFKEKINLKDLNKLKNNLDNNSNFSYLEKRFFNKRKIKLEHIENNKKYSNSLIYNDKDFNAIYDDIFNNIINNRLNNKNDINNNNDLKNNINKNNNNFIKRLISANNKKLNKNKFPNNIKLPLTNRTDKNKRETIDTKMLIQKNKNLTNNNLNRNYKIKHNDKILPDIFNKNGFGKNNSCINLSNKKFNNINKDDNIKNENKTLLSKIINNNKNNLLINKKDSKKTLINNSNNSNIFNDNIENFDTKEITLQKKNSINDYENNLYNNKKKKVKSNSIIESKDITFKNNESQKNHLSEEKEINSLNNNNYENNQINLNNTLLKSKSYRNYNYNNNNNPKMMKYPSTALLNKKKYENNSNLCFKDFLFDKNYVNSFSSRLHRNLSSLLLPISQFNYNNNYNNIKKNNKEYLKKKEIIKNNRNNSYINNIYYTHNQDSKTRNKENKFTLDNLKDNNNPYSLNWCNNLLKKNFGQELNVIGTINGAPKIGIKNSKSFTNFKDRKSNSNNITKRDFYKTLQKTYSNKFFNKIKEEKREKSGNIIKKYPSIYKYFNSNFN